MATKVEPKPLKTPEPPAEVPDIINFKQGFLLMEPFSAFVTVFCTLVGNEFLEIVGMDKNNKETAFQANMSFAIASWLALIYAYISDNFLGSKKMAVITGLIATIPTCICAISAIVQFYRTAEAFHIIILTLMFYSYFLLFSFRVVWRVLAVEQAVLPADWKIVRRYVAKLELLRILGTILAILTTTHVIKLFFSMAFVCFIVHILTIIIVVFFRASIYSEPVEMNGLNKYLYSLYKSCRDKMMLKNPSTVYERIGSKIKLSGGIEMMMFDPRYKMSVESEDPLSKKVTNLFMIIGCSFPFFMVQYVVWSTTLHFHAAVLSKSYLILEFMDPYSLSLCAMMVILFLIEFLILPFLRACRLLFTYFNLMSITYALITISVFFCSILEQKMSLNKEIKPNPNGAQLRIYNIMDEMVVVSSKWFPTRELKPLDMLTILSVRLGDVYSGSTNLSILFPSNKTINHTIIAEKGASHSCLISPEGFSMFEFTDPIDKGPAHANDKNLARVYAVSPYTNERVEEMVIWLYEEDRSSVEMKFPKDGNTSIANVPEGIFNVALRQKSSEQHLLLEKKLTIELGSIYMLLFMKSNRSESEYGTFMHMFTVLKSQKVSYSGVIFEFLLLDLAEVLMTVYLFPFVYLEAPPKMRMTILSILYCCLHYGFGYKFYLVQTERPTYMYLLTFSFVSMIFMFFFVYFANKYVSDGMNKYVYTVRTAY